MEPTTNPLINTSINYAYSSNPEVAKAVEEAALASIKLGPGFQEWLYEFAKSRLGSVHTEAILSKYYTQDPYMLEILNKIRVLANHTFPVLIQGPSGSGKDILANALHGLRANLKFKSQGNEGKFIAINCTALPPDLIESELFGHKRGAFTGAIQERYGKFALANNGTLFLDEIGDMPDNMQAKLLRVLQDGYYTPIGDEQSFHSSARIVCATNKDINQLAKDGYFRQDLLDRLMVFHIKLKGLNERINYEDECKLIIKKLFPEVKFSAEDFQEIFLNKKPTSVRHLQSYAYQKLVYGVI